jgi:hypothetical protein
VVLAVVCRFLPSTRNYFVGRQQVSASQ